MSVFGRRAGSRADVRARRVAIVGHRGGRGEGWPAENTLAAFARAHAEGADAIELDVRATRGDGVVVFHDATLARMTEGSDWRALATLSPGEAARVKLGASREPIPTLDDVLAWARGRLAVNVEVKHDVPDRASFARAVARSIARHAEVEVLVSSFNPFVLAAMAAIAPRAPRAWLTHEGQSRWEAAWAPIAARAPLDALHVERTQASTALVARAKRHAKRVGVWTVNDPREARDLASLGVDWLITDAPAVVRDALGRLS